MRILEIETFGQGGLAHYAHNLSSALADRGHEVILLTTRAYELEDQSRPAGFRVVHAIAPLERSIKKMQPAFARGLARKIQALFDACATAIRARRLQPDAIHLHCTNPISLVYLTILRLLRIPLVATAHVVTPHERFWLQDRVYQLIHRASSMNIAHSKFDQERLVKEFGITPERTAVIPHGEYGFFERSTPTPSREAARHSFGLRSEDEVALFFGYIREYKGLDVLFDAWPSVAAARPAARLLVAGDPVKLPTARREELQLRAESLGTLHHFGYVPFSDVWRYYAAADVLVMPYRTISQSGVLYLALAMGLPVLATDIGALQEVLLDGQSALLVPPESPSALAKGLSRLLGDADLQKRLASGGRRIAEKHSWPSIAEQTESVFTRLTSS